ncbi:hypothetical protein Mgra_00006105, partial [Meloidogyne graminicola]
LLFTNIYFIYFSCSADFHNCAFLLTCIILCNNNSFIRPIRSILRTKKKLKNKY